VRRKEAEHDKLHGSYQERIDAQRRQLEKDMSEHMAAIEGRDKKGHRDIEMIISKWKNGDTKGVLNMVLVAWKKHSHQRAISQRSANATELALRRWAEGDAKGMLRHCFSHWTHSATITSLEVQHEEEMRKQTANLQQMLEDTAKAHEDLQDRAAECLA